MYVLKNDELVARLIRLRTSYICLETVVELLIDHYEVKENHQTITLVLYMIYDQLHSSCENFQALIDELDK